jgi:ribonucleoside-diphosphate reductase alpha chain
MDYKLTDQQRDLFLDRYALKDKQGNPVEDRPEQMWARVAKAIGNSSTEESDFYGILEGFKFVPGGRILAGAGAETEKTFYNCYVIPVETKNRRLWRQWGYTETRPDLPAKDDTGSDSREAIFDTIGLMVDIMSRGGGVGINWSVLRPSGSYLTRVSGTSSGPVGWMDVASTAVGEVEQGGSRRGAAMFMLDDWHPDLLKFIDAKRTKGKITNANISVAVSDEFMETVRRGGKWLLRFPDTTDQNYNVSWDGDLKGWESRGGRVNVYGEVPAQDLWRAIAESAHASGEPGVVFLDRYNKLSNGAGIERLISVNPCGEQGLGAYSVCNLGAMNLYAYVVPAQDGDPIFNWPQFQSDVRVAIRFLDNAIDKNYYFLPETKTQQMKLRRIGLGVMGLADALVALQMRYGSKDAIEFTEKIFSTMRWHAVGESINLAEEKGAAEAFSPEIWSRPFFAELPFSKTENKLRNLFLLTQAPTGTTSLLAGVNSGVEPFFNLGYWREDRTGGRWIEPKSLAGLVFEYGKAEYVVTSGEVTVDEHVAMQAAVQKYVDSSVSKTINAPKDQTVEETAKAFDLAYDSGLKGLAYYRDGSRGEQVLYHQAPNEVIAELEAKVRELEERLKRPTGVDLKVNYVPASSVSAQVPDNIIYNWKPMSFVGHPMSCAGTVVTEEGCQKCYTCQWSAC